MQNPIFSPWSPSNQVDGQKRDDDAIGPCCSSHTLAGRMSWRSDTELQGLQGAFCDSVMLF